MENLPPIDPRLVARAREFAEHRVPEPEQVNRLSELLVPPPMLVEADDGAERARADAAALAKHTKSWRDNLRRYAPIERWEAAWDADDSDEFPAVATVADWLASGCKKHLVIMGSVGVGKSIAAATAVKRWVEPGERFAPVSWLEPDELVSAVMHAYDPNAPKLARYVVIDDMGTETKSDFGIALCKLLDRQGHTLLITTNLAATHVDPKKTIRGRYDARLLSRMNDSCTKFVVPGEDKRSKAGGF